MDDCLTKVKERVPGENLYERPAKVSLKEVLADFFDGESSHCNKSQL